MNEPLQQAVKDSLFLPPEQDGFLRYFENVPPMHRAHHHDELELNLVTDGTAAYLLGGRRYELRRHALVWLFPEQDHILLNQSPGFCMWIGVFGRGLLNRLCTGPATPTLLAANPPGHFCRYLCQAQAEQLDSLFGQVARVSDSVTVNAGLGFALLTAWEAFQQADDLPSGSAVHPAVEQAARIIRDEVEPLGLEALAERVGMSAPYFSALFRQQTGMTLSEFRNRQRVLRFVALYGQGQRGSMLEAALQAGFGSYPQFYRVFTELMGRSPAQYRRYLARHEPRAT